MIDYKIIVERLVFGESVDEIPDDFIDYCIGEYCGYEEGSDISELKNCKTPLDYAKKVYRVWTDYCYNQGLL